MTDEYKKALYDAFLKDTPVKYESVTDEQWLSMHNTVTGATIAITQALQPIIKAVGDALKPVLDLLANQPKDKK